MGSNQSNKQEDEEEEQKIEKLFLQFKEIHNLNYDSNMPYFLVLIGPSQAGKSSFIKMISNSDEQKQEIKVGDDLQSCTKQFSIYEIQNEELFGKRGAMILDSIGFGDTSGELDDTTILSLLHCKLLNAASTCQMRIDAILIFQNAKSPIKIKSLIKDIVLCLGEQAKEKTLICITKINALNDDDQYTYDDLKKVIENGQKELDTQIPVIDLYTRYFHRRKGEYIPDQSQMKKQYLEISQFLIKSKEGLDLCQQWNKVQQQAKQVYKTMINDDIDKKFGQLFEQYRKDKKKMGFLEHLKVKLGTFGMMRREAVIHVEKFYQENLYIAQKATEIVLCKEMRMKKFEVSEKQIENQQNKA